MSVYVMSRVWGSHRKLYADGSQHAGSELLLLMAIADFADDEGNAFPSVSNLAKKCRLSERYVNMLLAKLRDSGELEIHLNEGWKGANRYTVRVGLADEAQFTPLKPASSCSGVPKGVKPASEGGEAGFPKPLKPASPKPSENHQGTVTEPGRARASRDCTQDFVVSPEMLLWAKTNAPDIDVDHETQKFRLHERAKPVRDWPRAWKKWMLNAKEFAREQHSKASTKFPRNFADQDYSAGVSPDGRAIC